MGTTVGPAEVLWFNGTAGMDFGIDYAEMETRIAASLQVPVNFISMTFSFMSWLGPCDGLKWSELAALVGEVGKPTLLGYLTMMQELHAPPAKVFTPEIIRHGELIIQPEKQQLDVFARLVPVYLAGPVARLDVRSPEQKMVDEIETKLARPPRRSERQKMIDFARAYGCSRMKKLGR
jgi:hypothetical protein